LAIPVARRIARNSAAVATEPDPSGILEG